MSPKLQLAVKLDGAINIYSEITNTGALNKIACYVIDGALQMNNSQKPIRSCKLLC